MSSSDSSEDELNDQLLAAVDTSFLSDKLYKTPAKVDDTEKRDAGVKATPAPRASATQPVHQSNRYLSEEDSFFHSDLNVTSAVQKHVAEKLSKLINSVIEFDDSECNQSSTRVGRSIDEPGVRLLAGFAEVIDLNTDVEVRVNLKPKPIVRKKIDREQEVTDAEKIASSVCDPSTFPKEVQQWKGPRKRSIQYQYKKDKIGTLIEKSTPNEFTKARNANIWDESKIRKFKRCNPNEKRN
uniref:Protein CUSTOS n=1 Tax=Anopheles funestus TaxID=62324 RepID=A0A182RNP2_ANOFN